jgi:baseplate J-like protein
MPLTIPTLDTRRYQDLLDEALARIPVHNPEWTNFNRSDPGVTLIEVFAFLTESLIYRANQIPDRNRRKFLSLLGVPLQPASSARGLVTFSNDRGPRQTITLNSGIEVRAGEVPFRTDRGLDVLPIEARAFFKRPLPGPAPELEEYYRRLYASFRGQPASTDIRLYEPLPFPPPGDVALQGPLETVDQSIWVALLLRSSDAPPSDEIKDEVRQQIAARTLSLGVIPIVTDASRVLRPTGPNAEPAAALRYQLPSVPASGGLPTALAERVPQYRDLDPRTTTDVLTEPGVVELTLPSAGELTLWNNIDPLESGAADFPPALEDTNLADRVVTWLRVRAASAALPSQLKWLGINAAMVSQRAHVANEVLPDGAGEPDQTINLSRRPIVPGSVRLRVTVNNTTEEWTAIDDLLAAGPEVPVQDPKYPPGLVQPPPAPAKVFVVNLESGELRFGDGRRGARPPLGAAMRADYDFGVGRTGNVGPHAINTGPALPAGMKVDNWDRTWGGADAETADEGEKQIARHLQHRDRLVTAADFEAITLRTPGVEVGRVDVIPAYNAEVPQHEPGDAPGAVTLMVLPRTDPLQPDAPRPDRFFLNTICDYLDPRRLVTTEVILRGPIYKPIWISVGIVVVAGMAVPEVREAVTAALRTFLSPLPADGMQRLDDVTTVLRAPQLAERRKGWPLRKRVVAAELDAVVNRVEGVLFVNSLLVAQGTGAAQASIPMIGLELPRVAGISVTVGDPLDLDRLRGQSPEPTEASSFVPVPVVPKEC